MGGMDQRAVGSPELLFTECNRRHQCRWRLWKLFALFFKKGTSSCCDFAPEGAWTRSSLRANEDGHSSVYVLMRFSANQNTRLAKAESLMHKVSAEANQFTDFEEGSRGNVGVRQQEPRWAQRCCGFGNKDSTPGYIAPRQGRCQK